MSETQIGVYPVGAFSAAKDIRRMIKQRAYRNAWRRAKGEARSLRRRIEDGNWRILRKWFNGYLAEIDYPPVGLRHMTCGHGWTKKRAARKLGEYLWRDNGSSE